MSAFRDKIGASARDHAKDMIGATFWRKTTVAAVTILGSSALDISQTSTGGELQVEDVVIKGSHSGGIYLAVESAQNTFQILCTNGSGTAVILSSRVDRLGTDMTLDLDTARDKFEVDGGWLKNAAVGGNAGNVAGARTILETGKKLQVQNMGAAGTGSLGSLTIYVRFRKLSDDANILFT